MMIGIGNLGAAYDAIFDRFGDVVRRERSGSRANLVCPNN